ncbi:MAG TPA: PP2C family protein-serine/threonine phosphatase, partial [Thermoanaerobaculia bacterium]|nr:PP2C family protein-serine/threonine phosphatase [Thermoanaerobaculia bacterium]
TTDDVAVRRRFDQRNLVWWLLLLLFFALTSVIAVFEDRKLQDLPHFLSANASVVLVVIGLFLLRDAYRAQQASSRGSWRIGRWIRNHVSATVLTYAALQYTAALGFGGKGWIAWVMTFPFLVLGFRMPVAELVLLHVFLFGSGLGMALMTTYSGKKMTEFLIGAAVINAVCLAIELFTSYRLRKEVIADWSQRRTQAREQIRMRDELRYARELQLSMLPEAAPELEWADVASVCVPATEVGGDYYDYFAGRERLALVCGDVAGHGMASGLVLAAIRTGFTLLRDSLDNPATVLRRLHDLVAETSRRRMLVTVSVVLLDRTRGEATIASAGHPPVIVRRADGSIETLDLFAPPLGVRLPVEIPQRRIAFNAGDVFVLHSDGIYETRDASGEVYGLERLARVIDEHAHEPAKLVRDAIVEDVTRFRGATEQDDDVTVVVCRILETTT